MPPSSQEDNNQSGFFNRFFSNNPQNINDEIRKTLNENPPLPSLCSSGRSMQDEFEDVFKAFGFGGGAFEEAATTMRAMEREFETSPLHASPFATALQRSSYQIHQDNQQVQIEVDAPGMSKDDLKVEIVDMPACVVQWSGQQGIKSSTPSNQQSQQNYHHQFSTFSHRLRLGSSVDCQKLSANLNQGVLKMSAPIKDEKHQEPSIKSISITEHNE